MADLESSSSSAQDLYATTGPRTSLSAIPPSEIVKRGWLWKTSITIPGRATSNSRYFVLTKNSLDYYRNESCEKLKGRIPLAEMEGITKSGSTEGKALLKITGLSHPLTLICHSKVDAADWHTALTKGIKEWNSEPEERNAMTDGNLPNYPTLVMYPSLSLLYQLSKSEGVQFSDSRDLSRQEFPMIKYARAGKAIPHERVFKLDHNRLHIMWKKRGKTISGFSYNNTLSFDKVVEVRCGQQTKNFIKFPYTEVQNQSFSLIFEKEQGEWGQLCSLDLICDSARAYNAWTNALREIIYDKDPRCNRHKYDGVDPVLLWLMRHWSVLVSQRHGKMTVDQAVSFANSCCPEQSRRLLRNKVKEVLKQQGNKHDEKLKWKTFLLLYSTLNEQPRLYKVFCTYAKDHPVLGMTVQEFQEFLQKEQQQYLDYLTCEKLIHIHDKAHDLYKMQCSGNNLEDFQQSRSHLSFNGFLSFIRSQDNSIINPEHTTVYEDMDQPLTNYYINSSHNTYLTGRQLTGLSSLEAYVRALLQGCRCIELDCWDGADGPVITHGYTMTSSIKFRDAIVIIKEYAFETSEYPVILSLENHCSPAQQAKMVEIFLEVLGDMLVTQHLFDERRRANELPSPNELKRKILLKGKIKLNKKVSVVSKKSVVVKRPLTHTQSAAVIRSSGSSQPFVHKFSPLPTRPDGSPDVPRKVRALTGAGDGTWEVVPLEAAMDNLIIYCRAIVYKKGEVSHDCCEMFSFNDSDAMDLVQPGDVRILSNKHLVRVYPKGTRVDSTNYDPQFLWSAGAQMVSLNIQKPDAAVHLNQGKFRKNGGCGYILKPEALRNRAMSDNHTLRDECPKGGKAINFTIELLSGQNLQLDNSHFGRQPVHVEVETDCHSQGLKTEETLQKLNPQWKNAKKQWKVIMPEMSLVYFKVLCRLRNKTKLIFQTVISLDSIRPGLRYVPLRTPTGVEVPQSGLFVHIGLEDCEAPSCQPIRSSRERLITI